MADSQLAVVGPFATYMIGIAKDIEVQQKNHPAAIVCRRAVYQWVAKGARTLDLQSHNLALYPTEL
jgi:hypothetical protein